MFKLSSSEFVQGGSIPRKYSCEGMDISPPLSWTDTPAGTKSLVLIMDDPDAPLGTWVHWVIFNILPDQNQLPEALARVAQLDSGAIQGRNSWKRCSYGGPCPPGGTHRYFFKLYALRIQLDLDKNATRKDVLQAIEGQVLNVTELMGTYTRSKR